MIRVSNKACVRHLGRQSMKAAKTRNCIAVLAIALTTVLFTSLFTIALSINTAFSSPISGRRGDITTPPSNH